MAVVYNILLNKMFSLMIDSKTGSVLYLSAGVQTVADGFKVKSPDGC